jgi:hypothetical protein
MLDPMDFKIRKISSPVLTFLDYVGVFLLYVRAFWIMWEYFQVLTQQMFYVYIHQNHYL